MTSLSFSPTLPLLQHVQVDQSASSWSLQHPALQYHAFLGLSLLRKGQPSPMNHFEKASSQVFPDSVKLQIFTEQALDSRDHAALVAAVLPRLRMLKLVVERLAKEFTPYKHEPSYKLTYYVERLSCGHEQHYFPQAGPMSRRRHCAECASLPPKKLPTSVTTEEVCTKAI